MKIIVITDYIDSYDSSRLILESLMGLGEDVELVSLFFNEERLETPLSLYKIHSTGLNKIFKRSHSLFKWPLLTSQFAKKFKVPSADIYIVLSQGFSHLIPLPKNKEVIRYIYDRPYRTNRFFAEQLDKQYIKSINKLDDLYFSSHFLANSLAYNKPYEVLTRPFPSKDFKQLGNYKKSSKYVLNIDDYDEEVFASFIKKLGPEKELVVVTNKKTKNVIKKEYPFLDVISGISNHELYVELLNSRLYLDMRSTYPERAFCALATGIPCVLLDNFLNREVLGDGAVKYVKSFKEVINKLDLLEKNSIEADTLRRFSLRYNERVFKNKMLSLLRKKKS